MIPIVVSLSFLYSLIETKTQVNMKFSSKFTQKNHSAFSTKKRKTKPKTLKKFDFQGWNLRKFGDHSTPLSKLIKNLLPFILEEVFN